MIDKYPERDALGEFSNDDAVEQSNIIRKLSGSLCDKSAWEWVSIR
jgi:hypothetical protein